MLGFNSKLLNSIVVPVENSNSNNPTKRYILKEFDIQDGLTDVVIFKENSRIYCVLHDITGFIQNTMFAYTSGGWKKISYILDYHSWYSELIKDDLAYLEWEGKNHIKKDN